MPAGTAAWLAGRWLHAPPRPCRSIAPRVRRRAAAHWHLVAVPCVCACTRIGGAQGAPCSAPLPPPAAAASRRRRLSSHSSCFCRPEDAGHGHQRQQEGAQGQGAGGVPGGQGQRTGALLLRTPPRITSSRALHTTSHAHKGPSPTPTHPPLAAHPSLTCSFWA